MREVFHTRTADGSYDLFVGTNSKNKVVLGSVARSTEKVPVAGGKDGATKSETVYLFTPAAGVEVKGRKASTMKALKESVGADLPDAPAAADPMPATEAATA